MDRNFGFYAPDRARVKSLSARRAWIEIADNAAQLVGQRRRSPQGERG